MLHTVEAVYDPVRGLIFSEAVAIDAPIKVLVTFMQPTPLPTTNTAKGSFHALSIALASKTLPKSKQLSGVAIEAQLQEIATTVCNESLVHMQ